MSKYTELRILKNEEQVLMQLTGKLNDQLNRLKVEELALLSKLRSEDEAEQSEPTAGPSWANGSSTLEQEEEQAMKAEPILDLFTTDTRGRIEMDVEEEEEEDEDEKEAQQVEDDLTAFLTQLEHTDTKQES